MNPEGESLISPVVHYSIKKNKANTDKVTTNLSPLVSMTLSKILVYLVRIDMPIRAEASMNTLDPTTDLRGTLREVLELTSLMTLRIWRECLPLMGTPNRLKRGFMGNQNSTVGQ